MGLLLPIILITLNHNGKKKNCDSDVAQFINEVKQLTLLLVSYTKKLLVEQKVYKPINIFCDLFLTKGRFRRHCKNGLADSSFIH